MKKILPLTGLFILMIAVSSAFTQYIAASFQYHPALGKPLFDPFYNPFSWIGWQFKYYPVNPGLFNMIYGLSLLFLGVFLVFPLLVFGKKRSSLRHEGLHGTAHWASKEEIINMGLLPQKNQPNTGVYVGGWEDEKGQLHYLRHEGPEHIIAIAPTRSGKGVGLVVPTLLSWPHSCIVNDQKEELWNLTSGWRNEHIGPCYLFNPSAEHGSIGLNPLEEIRLGTINEVGDVQNLATVIVDPEGKGLNDHWSKTAHAFLVGAVLHVLYTAKAKNEIASLSDVALALSSPERSINEFYEDMVQNKWSQGKTHLTIASAAKEMQNRPEQERGSVLSTALSFLSLYRDPLIARNIARSTLKLSDIVNSEKPVSLYLVTREEDKDRMRPLMRLVLNQIVRVLLRPKLTFVNGQTTAAHKHKLLLMLDEFASYGRLDIFQEALSYIAGYGIKAYLIIQDISQLAIYGKGESLIANCHVRVAFAPNKLETAEWLSKMTGTSTVIKEDISTSGRRFGAILGNVSSSLREVSRPLATPDEILRLKGPQKSPEGDKIEKPGDVLVFVAGFAPIKGTQSLYFRDPVFQKRGLVPPPNSRTEITQKLNIRRYGETS